jgi:signal peptidase I
MTEDQRRPDPADDDEIADSLAIDEAADQHPAPLDPSRLGSVPPAHADAAATSPSDGPADPEPAASESAASESAASESAASEPARPVPTEAAAQPSGRRARKQAKRRKPARKAPWWELPVLVGLAIVIAILVKTFLVQPFYIPSESMEKTLHGCQGCSGDRILVSKIVYDFRDPHPGDIVVFNAPTGWDDEPPSTPPSNPVLRVIRGFGQLVGFVPPDGLVLVKRVIAVGGQAVKGEAPNRVFVSDNGRTGPWRELKENFVYETGPDPRATFGPIIVPKGRLWVMGDHRDRSADSRYHCGETGNVGSDDENCDTTEATVPVSAVIGKAFVVAWPPSRWTTLGTPKTFTSAAEGVAGAGYVPVLMVSPIFFLRRKRR